MLAKLLGCQSWPWAPSETQKLAGLAKVPEPGGELSSAPSKWTWMRLNPGTEAAGVVGGAEGGVGRGGLGAGGTGEDRLSAGQRLTSTPSQGADLCRWQGLPPAARTRQSRPGEEEPLPWEGCLWRLPRGRHRSPGSRLPPAGRKEGSSTPTESLRGRPESAALYS